jgi:hypothetical protein
MQADLMLQLQLGSTVRLRMTQEHSGTGAPLAHLENAMIVHFPQTQWSQRHHLMAENKNHTL